MKIKTLIWVWAILVAALLAGFPSLGQAQIIAIKAGKLVDPESATVVANQVILIEGRTIKSVGSNLKIPENATVIDLSKQTVLGQTTQTNGAWANDHGGVRPEFVDICQRVFSLYTNVNQLRPDPC